MKKLLCLPGLFSLVIMLSMSLTSCLNSKRITYFSLMINAMMGITGWAQVNGSRGDTKAPGAMQRRIDFDLYYIHRWTFWLDCQIILQTVINTVKGDENAY